MAASIFVQDAVDVVTSLTRSVRSICEVRTAGREAKRLPYGFYRDSGAISIIIVGDGFPVPPAWPASFSCKVPWMSSLP